MKKPEPTTPFDLLWMLAIPAALNTLACRALIPFSQQRLGLSIEAAYFLSVGSLALAPLFFAALFLTRREQRPSSWRALSSRLRLGRLSGRDWLWTIAGFVGLCAASAFLADSLLPRLGMDARPFFFQNLPLDDHNRWLLAAWVPFFFFNIMGEELYWRGYVLPRQELAFGRGGWLVNGGLWALWHLPMGLDLILAALPIFAILPFIAQFRRNTSIAIVIHAVFGAFGFLALALGALH